MVRFVGLAAAALLSACAAATYQSEAATDTVTGRLSVRVDAQAGQPPRSFAAPFELRGDEHRGQFSLFTPLGTTAARADWQPGHVLLVNDQGQRTYADLNSMATDLLGEPLPMVALLDWLRMRPWPGTPHAPTESGFDQLGWQIDTRARSEGRIEARRSAPPTITVRVRLESPL